MVRKMFSSTRRTVLMAQWLSSDTHILAATSHQRMFHCADGMETVILKTSNESLIKVSAAHWSKGKTDQKGHLVCILACVWSHLFPTTLCCILHAVCRGKSECDRPYHDGRADWCLALFNKTIYRLRLLGKLPWCTSLVFSVSPCIYITPLHVINVLTLL